MYLGSREGVAEEQDRYNSGITPGARFSSYVSIHTAPIFLTNEKLRATYLQQLLRCCTAVHTSMSPRCGSLIFLLCLSPRLLCEFRTFVSDSGTPLFTPRYGNFFSSSALCWFTMPIIAAEIFIRPLTTSCMRHCSTFPPRLYLRTCFSFPSCVWDGNTLLFISMFLSHLLRKHPLPSAPPSLCHHPPPNTSFTPTLSHPTSAFQP